MNALKKSMRRAMQASWLFLFAIVQAVSAGEVPQPAQSPADRWDSFRGNIQMTGVSASPLPETLELLWKIDSSDPKSKTKDSIEASAAIGDGVVYFGTLEGKFFAVNLNDGKQLWKFVNPDIDGVKSSPCLADELVCYGDDLGVLRALDRKTGELKWQVETNAEIISSPIFHQGKIIVGSYDESLYAIDAESGEVAWKVQTMGPVHCSPSYANGQVVVAGCDGFLRMVSVEHGKETTSLELGGNIVSTPAVVGNRLFVGTNDNTVVRVDIGETLTKQWVFTPKRQFPFFSSPAVTKDLCIIGGRDKEIHAIDQSTGMERWSFRTKARVDSSPVIVGDSVLVGSSDGNLYRFNVETGKKSWEYLTGAPLLAGPAVASGKLIVGNADGVLFCFGKR